METLVRLTSGATVSSLPGSAQLCIRLTSLYCYVKVNLFCGRWASAEWPRYFIYVCLGWLAIADKIVETILKWGTSESKTSAPLHSPLHFKLSVVFVVSYW